MRTTLNIHVEVVNRIDSAAKASGISRSEMIATLLRFFMNEKVKPDNIGKMVQYQDRCKNDEWRTVHVRFRVDDYECFIDMRKFYKMSVSKLVALSVKKFIINKSGFSLIGDNYPHKNYVLMKHVINDTITWKIIWGYPPEIEKILTIQ